jgi:hypothetical protein
LILILTRILVLILILSLIAVVILCFGSRGSLQDQRKAGHQ